MIFVCRCDLKQSFTHLFIQENQKHNGSPLCILQNVCKRRIFKWSFYNYFPSTSLQVGISARTPHASWPGRVIYVQRYGGLYMVLLQLQEPLKLLMKRKKFLAGSKFPSCHDMTQFDESDVKNPFFFPAIFMDFEKAYDTTWKKGN